MTRYIGEYSYIITPDFCCRIYKNGVFKWKSPPMCDRKTAEEQAENFIKANRQGSITLEVHNMSVDPDSFFGGRTNG